MQWPNYSPYCKHQTHSVLHYGQNNIFRRCAEIRIWRLKLCHGRTAAATVQHSTWCICIWYQTCHVYSTTHLTVSLFLISLSVYGILWPPEKTKSALRGYTNTMTSRLKWSSSRAFSPRACTEGAILKSWNTCARVRRGHQSRIPGREPGEPLGPGAKPYFYGIDAGTRTLRGCFLQY